MVIASFDGWVDAAEAASDAVAHIGAGGTMVATFDADAIFDYRSRRPILDVEDGRLSELRWPELALRHVRVAGRDLLVFSGAEPDLRWQELASDVAELMHRLGVVEWVSLGAVPAAVAHTRPVPLMATASRDDLLAPGEARGPEGLLRVPAAALSALEMAVTASGIPAAGFFAQVPPYASIGYAAASVALVERLGRHLGIDVRRRRPAQRRARAARPLRRGGRRRRDAADTVRRLESVAGELDEPSSSRPATSSRARSSASCAARASPATADSRKIGVRPLCSPR